MHETASAVPQHHPNTCVGGGNYVCVSVAIQIDHAHVPRIVAEIEWRARHLDEASSTIAKQNAQSPILGMRRHEIWLPIL